LRGWHKKVYLSAMLSAPNCCQFLCAPYIFFFLFFYIHLQTEPNPLPSYPPPTTPSFGCCFISFHLHFRVSFSFFLSDVYRFLFGRDDCQLSGGGWWMGYIYDGYRGLTGGGAVHSDSRIFPDMWKKKSCEEEEEKK